MYLYVYSQRRDSIQNWCDRNCCRLKISLFLNSDKSRRNLTFEPDFSDMHFKSINRARRVGRRRCQRIVILVLFDSSLRRIPRFPPGYVSRSRNSAVNSQEFTRIALLHVSLFFFFIPGTRVARANREFCEGRAKTPPPLPPFCVLITYCTFPFPEWKMEFHEN